MINFNNNYEKFCSSLKDIKRLEDKSNLDQVIILPKKYKELSYKRNVTIYKNGQTKYISFVQRKNYVNRSYIQIVYTKNNINDLKYYIEYDKIEFKKIKDNWYYVYVEKYINDKYVPLGYYNIEREYKQTHRGCLQDADTCYVSYAKFNYRSIPDFILNSQNQYEKINNNNKSEIMDKIFQFEKNAHYRKPKIKYDYVKGKVNKNNYVHIEEHDWSYELYIYDVENNLLYRFHGYD